MNYQKYIDMALERISDGRLPQNFKMWTEEEYDEWAKPIKETPPLKEQRDFVLAYDLIYKKLKRLAKGTDYEKEIDEIYDRTKIISSMQTS